MPVARDTCLGFEKGSWRVETRGWGSKRGVEGSRRAAGARRRMLVGLDVLVGLEKRWWGSRRVARGLKRGGGGLKRMVRARNGYWWVERGVPVAPDACLGWWHDTGVGGPNWGAGGSWWHDTGCQWGQTRGWGPKSGVGGCRRVLVGPKQVVVGVNGWWWVETRGWESKTGAGG